MKVPRANTLSFISKWGLNTLITVFGRRGVSLRKVTSHMWFCFVSATVFLKISLYVDHILVLLLLVLIPEEPLLFSKASCPTCFESKYAEHEPAVETRDVNKTPFLGPNKEPAIKESIMVPGIAKVCRVVYANPHNTGIAMGCFCEEWTNLLERAMASGRFLGSFGTIIASTVDAANINNTNKIILGCLEANPAFTPLDSTDAAIFYFNFKTVYFRVPDILLHIQYTYTYI